MKISNILLSCLLAVTTMVGTAGAAPSQPEAEGGSPMGQVQAVDEIHQYGGLWAGPDLSGRSRNRREGDIVGKPPVQRTGPATTSPPPTPPVTRPTPPTPPVSVAPPPVLPPKQVGGFQNIQQLFDNGSLIPNWIGQGRVAGDMLELQLQNTTNQAIAIAMEPGMVLELGDSVLAREFQPVMLEGDSTLLVPANGTLTKMLRGYCLDYNLEPPAAGRSFPYRFPADTVAYAPAMKVLKNSLNYDAEKNVMPVNKQRTIVIQRSVWAALGQTDKEKLYEDILKDAASSGKSISKRKARRLADALWSEVERLMNMAQ